MSVWVYDFCFRVWPGAHIFPSSMEVYSTGTSCENNLMSYTTFFCLCSFLEFSKSTPLGR